MLRRSAIGLLVATLILALGEGILRVAIPRVAQATIPADEVRAHVAKGAMAWHPELGWTWSRLPQPEVGINGDGFRYGDLPRDKPPGVLRGFALGDSQTYGAGVRAVESWPAVAERSLRDAGVDVQVVNAGISGYHSLQVLRLAQSKLVHWDPDFLLIDCFTHDSEREVAPYAGPGPLQPVRRLLFASRLYYALRVAVAQARTDPGERMRPGRGKSRDLDPGNHDLLIEFGRRAGIDVYFVDYPLWFRGEIISRAPAHDLPEGAVVLPATAALVATGKPAGELFYDQNHLTAEGNRVVGEAVAGALRPLLQ